MDEFKTKEEYLKYVLDVFCMDENINHSCKEFLYLCEDIAMCEESFNLKVTQKEMREFYKANYKKA